MQVPPATDWYRAVTLAERIESLRRGRHEGEEAVAGWVSDRAQELLERWRSQSPFETGGRFEQRLAMDGLDEAGFARLLGESADEVGTRFPAPPSWLEELLHAYAQPPVPPIAKRMPERLAQGPDLTAFLRAIEPLIDRAWRRVEDGIRDLGRTHDDLPFVADDIPHLLFAGLVPQLLARLSRTMVLELNVARLEDRLAGETPEERFQSFIARLEDRDTALAILVEYPVLARQLVVCIGRWASFSLEFLQRLCADWSAIQSTFGHGQGWAALSAVRGNAGDQHRGGRSVLILEFDGGRKLVYKPRSLAVDFHFQELLSWLNQRGEHPSFRTLAILDRGSHGWVEFVQAQGCDSPEEVQRFYRRQGGYLALLYVLQASDFHFENLIAAGENPVLIDLESLFQPRFAQTDSGDSDVVTAGLMSRSVLRVGLLPQRVWGNQETEGIDISGLASVAGQLTPRGVPSWEAVGTDEMRFIRKRMPIPGKDNRPSLDGHEVALLDYVEEIVTGLTQVYRLLQRNRADLLASEGPLARFAQDEIRMILRPTRAYGLLLTESFHPDLLRDGLDRDRFFDRLWVGIDYRPHLVQAIPAEREDLQAGDIPLFWTRPAARDLWTSADRRIAEAFPRTGSDLVGELIAELSEEDLARQAWFIRASLATLGSHADRMAVPPRAADSSRSEPGAAELVAAARALGDRLAALALRNGGEANWIGLSYVDSRRWALLPLGMDLYSGLPGMALFLAHLGAISGESRYTELAREALATLRRYLGMGTASVDAIGAFSGWGGLIYALVQIAALWRSAELLDQAEETARRAAGLIPRDERLDLIGGSAGCICPLLGLHALSPSDRTLATAVLCGDHLIARAQPAGTGLAWHTSIPAMQPLCGFSHGVAGIAWALSRLAAATGEDRFLKTAREALAYERSCFSAEERNWPDFRDFVALGQSERAGGDGFLATWCHGAPGVALGRLASLDMLDDAESRSEIRVALETTLERGFGISHCLCHGDLGSLEPLLLASETLGEPKWRIEAGRVAASMFASAETHGWLCGTTLGVETPGLMTGLAGIGLGLLRLAERERVPSVLTLAPPGTDVSAPTRPTVRVAGSREP